MMWTIQGDLAPGVYNEYPAINCGQAASFE